MHIIFDPTCRARRGTAIGGIGHSVGRYCSRAFAMPPVSAGAGDRLVVGIGAGRVVEGDQLRRASRAVGAPGGFAHAEEHSGGPVPGLDIQLSNCMANACVI